MKIVEIGSLFDQDYVHQVDYLSDYYLLDADIIFVSIRALILEVDKQLKSTHLGGEMVLPAPAYKKFQEKIIQRNEQLREYLNKGGNLFVLTDAKPVVGLLVEDGNGDKTEIQFDFYNLIQLDKKDFPTVTMEGNSMIYPDPDFEEYFRYWDCSYEFSYSKYVGFPIAKVKNTHQVVSVAVPKGKGLVVLLPKLALYAEDYNDFQMRVSKTKKGTIELANNLRLNVRLPLELDLPEWCDSLIIGNEGDDLNQLDKFLDEKSKIEESISQQQEKLKQYKQLKQLLTESGKSLEAMVEFVFSELGFTILPAGHNRDDLIIKADEQIAVIEVKGVKGSAGENHAAQLMKWVTTYHSDHGMEPKGILIINGFREKPLQERTEKIFPTQMLGYSERMQLCLLTTAQLLTLYLDFVDGKIDSKAIKTSLFATVGELQYNTARLLNGL
ncbi:hypothetical protein ACS5PU_02110 [Pedobacter sp. GSP4]|uniref:hypothetical protein n=1 Tax=Pedobacter sp. GSP4 TaxID=3453716 RepID=UPI003EEEE113